METLHALEKKIEALVEYIKTLKHEYAAVKKEAHELREKIVQLESSLLKETVQSEKTLQQEQALVSAVDELIKNIDDILITES